MSKYQKSENGTPEETSGVPVKKERIGIFLKKWIHVVSYGVQTNNKSYKHYAAWKIVVNEKELDELLALGAPIGVYVRDDVK